MKMLSPFASPSEALQAVPAGSALLCETLSGPFAAPAAKAEVRSHALTSFMLVNVVLAASINVVKAQCLPVFVFIGKQSDLYGCGEVTSLPSSHPYKTGVRQSHGLTSSGQHRGGGRAHQEFI